MIAYFADPARKSSPRVSHEESRLSVDIKASRTAQESSLAFGDEICTYQSWFSFIIVKSFWARHQVKAHTPSVLCVASLARPLFDWIKPQRASLATVRRFYFPS